MSRFSFIVVSSKGSMVSSFGKLGGGRGLYFFFKVWGVERKRGCFLGLMIFIVGKLYILLGLYCFIINFKVDFFWKLENREIRIVVIFWGLYFFFIFFYL